MFKIVFQVPLGLIFKNENANEDMIEILQQFHDYLPQTHNGGVDGQLFSEDQPTTDRTSSEYDILCGQWLHSQRQT